MTVGILVQETPRIPRPPIDAGWDRMSVLVEDWTKKVWDLTDPAGGVFLVRGGVRGFANPPIEHYRDRSAAVPGAFYRGTNYGPREFFFPLYLYHDESTVEFYNRERAFWRGLHPRHEVKIIVEIPGVGRRWIMARLESDNDWAPEIDPGFVGWATYGIRLQADDPFWRPDEPYRRTYEAEAPVAFHGGLTPGAPVVRISNGRSMSTATVSNPGDEEAWPVWTIHGPTDASGVVIVVNGRQITVPIALAEGDKVVIDTAPTRQTAYRHSANGSVSDVFSSLGDVEFEPIPPGETIDLILDTSGTGNIEIELMPIYLRAW